MLKKIVTADKGASGATRIAGSINRKPTRNGFRVRIEHIVEKRFTTASELDAAGLLAPEPCGEETLLNSSVINGFRGKFPDYQKCLEATKTMDTNEYDRSAADASFMKISQLRGFTREESMKELVKLSERYKEEEKAGNGEWYLNNVADCAYGKQS